MYPPLSLWWNCLHPIEWGTLIDVTGSVLYAPFKQITDLEFSVACLVNGLEYGSWRFDAFIATYPMVLEHFALPPPLDAVWQCDPTAWAEIDAAFAQGYPDQAECEIFAFKGNQGGAWPVLWPP